MLKADFRSTSSKPVDIRKMPLVRRRRPLMNLSSSPVTTTVDAQGTAYLCFPEDHSWFQGNISTDDESNYSLYGERITMTNEEMEKKKAATDKAIKSISEENNNNADSDDMNGNNNNNNNNINNKESQSDDEEEQESEYYRVTMIDHFSGQQYTLPKIFAKTKESSNGTGHLFASQHGEVTFQVENAYKGQKADLMIQRYLACPSLLGKKCMLYTGEISILFNDEVSTGRSWCL